MVVFCTHADYIQSFMCCYLFSWSKFSEIVHRAVMEKKAGEVQVIYCNYRCDSLNDTTFKKSIIFNCHPPCVAAKILSGFLYLAREKMTFHITQVMYCMCYVLHLLVYCCVLLIIMYICVPVLSIQFSSLQYFPAGRYYICNTVWLICGWTREFHCKNNYACTSLQACKQVTVLGVC